MGEGEFETLLGIPGAWGPGIREARENRTQDPTGLAVNISVDL